VGAALRPGVRTQQGDTVRIGRETALDSPVSAPLAGEGRGKRPTVRRPPTRAFSPTGCGRGRCGPEGGVARGVVPRGLRGWTGRRGAKGATTIARGREAISKAIPGDAQLEGSPRRFWFCLGAGLAGAGPPMRFSRRPRRVREEYARRPTGAASIRRPLRRSRVLADQGVDTAVRVDRARKLCAARRAQHEEGGVPIFVVSRDMAAQCLQSPRTRTR